MERGAELSPGGDLYLQSGTLRPILSTWRRICNSYKVELLVTDWPLNWANLHAYKPLLTYLLTYLSPNMYLNGILQGPCL